MFLKYPANLKLFEIASISFSMHAENGIIDSSKVRGHIYQPDHLVTYINQIITQVLL